MAAESKLRSSREVVVIEKSMRRVFLGACVLTACLALLLLVGVAKYVQLPPFARLGMSALLFWSIAVTAYAFHALYNFLAQIKQELNSKTFLDDGTGVYNFRYLDMRASEEYERTRRYGGSLAVLFLDLDKFKQVNDRYGHQVGNIVLKEIATTARQQMRACDVLGRIGGDEFLAILPQTDRKQAKVLADRLRQSIEQYSLRINEKNLVDFVRISIGIAAYPANGDSVESIICAADKAVYEAKRRGGNQVFISGGYITTETVGHKVIRTVESETATAEVSPRANST